MGVQVGGSRRQERQGGLRRARRGAAEVPARLDCTRCRRWHGTRGGVPGPHRVDEGPEHQRVGVRGQLPDGQRRQLGTTPAGWPMFGSYAKKYGFRIVGTHDGPSPTSAANLGSAITKMNGWNCNQLGAGSGWPAVPGRGHGDHDAGAISAWQASCATMNSLGPRVPDRRRQRRARGQPAVRRGAVQRHRRSPGRPCARYYRHFHSEQGKWITGTGTKYDNNYISAVAYTELESTTRTRSPICAGCWTACGCRAAARASACRARATRTGPGQEPPDGAGRHRALAGSRVHVPRQGPRPDRSGHAGRQRRRQQRARARRRTRSARCRTTQPGHDAVPADLRAPAAPGAPRVPVRARRHERDRHEQRLLEEDLRPGRRHVRQARARPHRACASRSRIPAPTPSGPRSRSRRSASVRPPIGGAPGPACPPKLDGGSEVGDTVEVADTACGRASPRTPRNYNYIWLRDGAPLAKYNGAPIGDEDGAVHGRRRARPTR